MIEIEGIEALSGPVRDNFIRGLLHMIMKQIAFLTMVVECCCVPLPAEPILDPD